MKLKISVLILFSVDADGNHVYSSFAAKKLVKTFNSLQAAFAFTFAMFPILNYEFPTKASWTWEVVQRLFANFESEKGILRGQKKDPHGLNKCDVLCGELLKILSNDE